MTLDKAQKIETMPAVVETKTVDKPIDDFLNKQANGFKLLLAHAEDGVIWGKVEAGKLVTSTELNASTLLEARLFSKTAELLVWKDDDGNWQGRVIRDVAQGEKATFGEYYDETQMLWGTGTGDQDANGFIEMIDGAQGMRHRVPALPELNLKAHEKPAEPPKRRLRLVVRHYLQADPITTAVRVVASRLVELTKA